MRVVHRRTRARFVPALSVLPEKRERVAERLRASAEISPFSSATLTSHRLFSAGSYHRVSGRNQTHKAHSRRRDVALKTGFLDGEQVREPCCAGELRLTTRLTTTDPEFRGMTKLSIGGFI